ncbi:GAF domain-containing sensor histidine kinase [Halostagnicola sp. A-GB9-2]|uniref:GAF domain-containing sensor histidine kinase n=1 Tax=Halostagnicola sp. A-GB9-2 TaxID=3048066 RepID=UPI0024C07DB5|nr:GAF domain-containing sensor histidine kinase [Halostagnicola sp. A-GB9-2]MDJ1430789.1 GAF domain-containing sensor histidine kinase [Halostagnicola sp. A-GB9-2]
MSHAYPSPDAARFDLYEVMKTDLSFEEKARRALDIGEEYLNVDNGHLTKIDPQSDYWKAIVSTDPPDGSFPPGLVVDLQTTYCRRTITQNDPIALHDAPNQGWDDDPAFETHGLNCYHGTTISIDDEAYGTVCFVSETSREEPFTAEETSFAELISRMIEYELKHQRTVDKLEHVEQFASVLSHDLRNPLNVAQGRIELAREIRDSEHLAIASDGLDRMDDLISDVLTMARQGREIDETAELTLQQLVQTCWQSVETQNANLVVEDDLTFRGASARVKRLFENLFRNAVEHGSNDVTVRVGSLENGTGFYVEDDGPGIPRDVRDSVFETGYSTGDDGIGIGLSIVSGVVMAHEWSIRLLERPDGGARFEIGDVIVAGQSLD